MPRVKEVRYCILCGSPFHRHNGNTKAQYCSNLCACRSRHTFAFQSKAGKAGSKYAISKRGTGTKTYVKFYGQHQHRVMMECHLQRCLASNEIVHHIDGDKHNNDITNLQLMTRAEHARVHLHGKTI